MHRNPIIYLMLLFLTSCIYNKDDIKNVPSDLLHVAEELKKSNFEQNSIILSIKGDNDNSYREIMKKNNIDYILFFKENEQTSISFEVSIWLHRLRPRQYFKYSLTGYTEEYQVDSIEKSIANNRHDFYHFCQKLDEKNWFYCESKD